MPKVVHLTSAHAPTDTRIFGKECRSLAEAGYDTVLVAPHKADEVRDGVQIRAIEPAGDNRFSRMTKTVYRVYRAALREDADLYHFHDPELIPVGVALRMKGKKTIYDAHEDLPRQILTKTWIPGSIKMVAFYLAEILEAVAARTCSGIVAATPKIARRFPDRETALVQNFPIVDELATSSSVAYKSRPNRAIYLGGIGRVRGVWEMVKAIGEVNQSLDARLRIAGKFTSKSDRKVTELEAWQYVDFKGWLTRKQVNEELHRARVGLVVLHPTPSYIHSQPVKLFEYMAAGLPVIASDFTLWRTMISEVRCGLMVDPLDTSAIAEAIEWIVRHPREAEEMGRRGRKAVLEMYNWQKEAPSLINLYDQVLRKS